MVDKDILLAKVDIIQRCLRRIKDTTNLSADSLDDFDKQDIFVLNLQRAIQAAIDISSHIAATERLGLPRTSKDCFNLLETSGIIKKELSSKMASMAGFRNIIVHDYRTIDINIMKSILENRLKDLECFYSEVFRYFNI